VADKGFTGVLISDFNIGNFSVCFGNSGEFPEVRVVPAPYGQVMPLLIERERECWQNHADFAVIWTQPQSVIPSFLKALNYQTVSLQDILKEVDEYASLLRNLKERVMTVLVHNPHDNDMLVRL